MAGLTPTYAQLGDASQPFEHSAEYLPDGRDSLPISEQAEDAPAASRFAFRMTGQMVRPNNRAATDGLAGISTVDVHQSNGEADRRLQYDALTTPGYPRLTPAMAASPESVRIEDHGPSVGIASPGLTVNKAGSTSADPAHPAGVPRYNFDRPFDQVIAHHPLSVSKLERPSPLASLPMRQTVATGAALPNPGGVAGVTVMDTSVGDHRNTVRQVPTPWDESAVVGTSVLPVTPRIARLT